MPTVSSVGGHRSTERYRQTLDLSVDSAQNIVRRPNSIPSDLTSQQFKNIGDGLLNFDATGLADIRNIGYVSVAGDHLRKKSDPAAEILAELSGKVKDGLDTIKAKLEASLSVLAPSENGYDDKKAKIDREAAAVKGFLKEIAEVDQMFERIDDLDDFLKVLPESEDFYGAHSQKLDLLNQIQEKLEGIHNSIVNEFNLKLDEKRELEFIENFLSQLEAQSVSSQDDYKKAFGEDMRRDFERLLGDYQLSFNPENINDLRTALTPYHPTV